MMLTAQVLRALAMVTRTTAIRAGLAVAPYGRGAGCCYAVAEGGVEAFSTSQR